MAAQRINPFGVRSFTPSERRAIQACWKGEADANQQHEALNLVVTALAQIRKTPYQSGDPYDTAFLGGRQFVGQALLDVIETPIPNQKTITGGKK